MNSWPSWAAGAERGRAGLAAAAAALVAAGFLLIGLGRAPLDDPGEGMHAEIARELLLSGDPGALTLNGVPYLDKPPLLYYVQAVAFAVAGLDEAAARLGPALGAAAAVAATAWLGARLLGPAAGFLAGMALLGSGLFFAFGRYVRPESLFVAALAWGFALLLAGLGEGRRRLAGAGLVAFGVAGLAKDPLGVVLPPLAVTAALAAAGRARQLAREVPGPALAASLALGLGWWIVAETRTPGAVWYTVVDNKILNVAGIRLFPDEDVPLTAVEFLAVALAGAAPWTLAAGVATVRLCRDRAWRRPDEVPWLALALWAAGVLAVTTLSQFRLPHYGLPAYPAVALLAARAWAQGDPRRLAAAHAVVFAALAVLAGLAAASDGNAFLRLVAGATDVATRRSRVAGQAAPFPGWEAIQPLLVHAALVLGAAALALVVALAARRHLRPAAAALVAVATLAILPAVAVALGTVAAHRTVRELARTVAARAGPRDVLVHEGPIEASGALEWYAGLRPVIVDGRRSVLAFGATRPGAREIFWTAEDLRAAWAGERRLWIVSVRAPEHSAAAALPGARLVAASGGHWLYTRAE